MATPIARAVASRRDKKAFLELPWKLYRGDPNWIPPLRLNQKELVGYKHHPFYDDAEAQTFLATRDGEICGRIAAIVHHAHNRRHNERRGFFGFFESIQDQEVAAALFNAARAWLAERDIRDIRGPMNPSFNYEMGLLVDGFDTPPTFMMTYNPPYYAELIEGYGFQKVKDLYAYWGHADMIATLDKKLWFVIEESQRRFNFKIRPLDRSRFDEDVRTFLRIYNEANINHWGAVPLSEGEIRHMSASMRHLIVPKLTALAEVDGRVVGTVFGLLDYNPRIRQIDGRLFPTGFIRLLWNRRQIKRVRMIATHVLPEYQRWGLGLVLLNALHESVRDWELEECEFSWVMECNKLSRGSLERGGAKRIKTYRLYDYSS